jgi:hypothetical protein
MARLELGLAADLELATRINIGRKPSRHDL